MKIRINAHKLTTLNHLNSFLEHNGIKPLQNSTETSYTNLKFPNIKYFNFGMNIPNIDCNLSKVSEEVKIKSKLLYDYISNPDTTYVIIGDKIASGQNRSCGTYPLWTGNMYLIPLRMYDDLKSHYMSGGSNFFDNGYLNESGLNKIKEYHQNSVIEIINELAQNDISLKEKELPFIDLSNEKIKDLISVETSFLKVSELPNTIDKRKVKGKEEIEGITLKVYGQNNATSIDLIETIKQQMGEYSTISSTYKGTEGQDWNSKIWKEGGLHTITLIPTEMLKKQPEIIIELNDINK